MPFKTFLAGTEGLASDINTYLMEQSVMVFASAAARNTALPTPNEGMVTYQEASDHLTIYNGTAWIPFDTKWTDYTPTFTNLTLGNATISSKYFQIGKLVTVQIGITFGTTSAVTGQITVSLPLTAANIANGSGDAVIAGTRYALTPRGSGQNILLWADNTAGTYAVRTATSATIPGTWANLSSIAIHYIYQAA